jgi:hypothetical protein
MEKIERNSQFIIMKIYIGTWKNNLKKRDKLKGAGPLKSSIPPLLFFLINCVRTCFSPFSERKKEERRLETPFNIL